MLDHLKNYRIVLGSNSPRRKELLAGLGLSFEVKPMPDLDESYPDSLKGGDIPEFIARKKASAYRPCLAADELLLTADTIVYTDDRVLGKPADRAEAIEMLRLLSGHTHRVYTGVCLTTRDIQRSFQVETRVRFAALEPEEIEWYVDCYRPFDKAGAYGVQEWIGYIAVEHIEGSYFNVMGLPTCRLYAELKQW